MNLQAQRDLSIAGDVVGRDKITINITRGLDELPTRYDSRVQNFLEYYLGAKDHPAPFGGRASDLAALDTWLDDPAAPPYASLIAPAGRGKSALLAHWITRLASRPETGAEAVHVVYFPISIRFNTNLETVVFASLAARIAHVFGEKVTYTPDTSQYRGVFSDYLRRTPPNGGRVLVVLDGLDEAAGWEAGADLFPTVAPGHLRVIVAARPLALDKDETAWLNRLGWETPNRAQRLSLAGLDREGVRDVLSQMGNPLDALATKIDLISRLYELSAGDPLLVRLYVEALLPQGAQAATLSSDDLAKLQPGLEAYFKRWFEEQQKLWGAAKPLQDKTVRGLLNLCAAALGPLKKDDVLTLGSDIFEDSGLLDEAAQAVNRFIIGDGLASGYVFSHPRLAEYFAGKLTNRECEAWQARFLQYGRDTLTVLENKTLLPKNAPAYAVQYYSAHLAQAKASAADFHALVCESWLRAWEWLEGTPAGFLNDVDRAWQKAEAEGPAALGQQIRAALCFASVTSLSVNIPKDLLVACVKAGVISTALGLVMARQKPDLNERAECLAAIAEIHPAESDTIMNEALAAARAILNKYLRAYVLGKLTLLSPKREQREILAEALIAARMILDKQSCARMLWKLALQLPEHEQAEVLGEALLAAFAISDDRSRVEVLVKLAPLLPEREQKKVIAEALIAARVISNEESRATALMKLASLLPKCEQRDVAAEALLAARAILREEFRAEALGKLAPQLPEHEQTEVLKEALSTALAISNKWNRALVLRKLATHLPEHEQAVVFEEALSAALSISGDDSRAQALSGLAPRLPEGLIGKALSAARAISDERYRAHALGELALRLPEHEQAEVLREALTAARAVSDARSLAEVLWELAPRLPEREQGEVLGDALLATRAISDEMTRVEVLGELALRLPEREQAEVLELALLAACTISDEGARAYFLSSISLLLPDGLLVEVLSAVRAISDEKYRAHALGELVPRLPESKQWEVLREALSAAQAISDARSRAKVLGALAPLFPEHDQAGVLVEALSAARTISDDWARAKTLGALAPRFAVRKQAEVLGEALLAACKISVEGTRALALRELAPGLPESLLREALSAARAISDEEFRARVLVELASYLPEHEWAGVLEEALTAVRAISAQESRAKVFGKLAPRLSEHGQTEVLMEAWSVARTISDDRDHAEVLGALAQGLPECEQVKVFDEALAATCAISNESDRAEVLGALVPHLPENLLDEALQTARTLCNQKGSIDMLSNLATRWSAVCRSTQRSEFEELSATLRAFARTKRPQLLQAIQALLPVITEQGGVPALRETARAIVDTAKWWP